MGYAIIYIHTEKPKMEILDGIVRQKILPDSNLKSTVRFPGGGVALFKNKEHQGYSPGEIIFPEDYYKFSHYLDFYSGPEVSEEIFKGYVSDLLDYFWRQGIPAVAEGYEYEGLRDGSGYGDPGKPWP